MNTNPIIITGTGVVSCLGLDCESTWAGILRGQCGMAELTAVESPLPEGTDGGQAPIAPEQIENSEPREVMYLRIAIAEALHTAGLNDNNPYHPTRCGVMLGTTLHGMRAGGRFFRTHDLSHLASFLGGSTMQRATVGFGIGGFCTTVCSACSSGLASITLATSMLSTGALDMVIAGGYDPVSEYAYAGFNSMRLVARGPLLPFSKHRKGMKLSEGYGLVVLERMDDVQRRNGPMHAVVAGFGESCDAHHLSQPHPEGIGAASAMNSALNTAQISPNEIDLIAAHSTATPNNDAAEFAALSRVFGDTLGQTPVVGYKSHLGHTLGGAGALELVLSTLAIRDQLIPACANVEPQDVEFDSMLLATGDTKKASVLHTLNTSLGFGGSNTSVVLESVNREKLKLSENIPTEDARQSTRKTGPSLYDESSRDVMITGVGVVLPDIASNDAFAAWVTRTNPTAITDDTGGLDRVSLDDLLNARRIRRMSDYVKLSLAASASALQDAGIDAVDSLDETCSAILGTTHGSTSYCEQYYSKLVTDGVDAANPLLFAEGVPNAAAAHLSTMMSIKGFCQSVIGTRTAGLEAMTLAAHRIRSGLWNRAIVGAADEYSTLINNAYEHFGHYRGDHNCMSDKSSNGFVTGCGAVCFVLESRVAAQRRGARIYGAVDYTAGDTWMTTTLRESIAGVQRVHQGIMAPKHLLVSANQTYIDRIEFAGLRTNNSVNQSNQLDTHPIVSTAYGHMAECFSAGPLAALAGVLLTKQMPKCLVATPKHVTPAVGEECPDVIGVVASDYAGSSIGISVKILPKP